MYLLISPYLLETDVSVEVGQDGDDDAFANVVVFVEELSWLGMDCFDSDGIIERGFLMVVDDILSVCRLVGIVSSTIAGLLRLPRELSGSLIKGRMFRTRGVGDVEKS